MFDLSDMKPGPIFDQLFDDLKEGDLCRQDIIDNLTRRQWWEDPRGSDDRSLALLINPAIAAQAYTPISPTPQDTLPSQDTTPSPQEELSPQTEA